MRIIYPYNEILPKKTAHDVYLFHECAALACQGAEVTLLCGSHSAQDASLFAHYQADPSPHFHIRRLPMIRKNTFFKMSWNFPFFFFSQREIERERPEFVFLSVLKQAAFHLERKKKGTRYLYEVHQLRAYPTSQDKPEKILQEKQLLEKADLITVTTEALRTILRASPYHLTNPIEVVPLAVRATSLGPPSLPSPFTVAYVGQLYAGQGIPVLLEALAQTSGIHLKILGGTPSELQALHKTLQEKNLSSRVHCEGFQPPSQLPSRLKDIHAFVAPFEPIGRMPYVAHTKLFEYAEWGRPILAPDLPIVHEHFKEGQGVMFFEAGNAHSLAHQMNTLSQSSTLARLQKEIETLSGSFTWDKRAKKYMELLSRLYSEFH